MCLHWEIVFTQINDSSTLLIQRNPLDLFKQVKHDENTTSGLTQKLQRPSRNPAESIICPETVVLTGQWPANRPIYHNRSMDHLQQHKRCSRSTVLCIVVHSDANTSKGDEKKSAHSVDWICTFNSTYMRLSFLNFIFILWPNFKLVSKKGFFLFWKNHCLTWQGKKERERKAVWILY